jgi:hypothetical protein
MSTLPHPNPIEQAQNLLKEGKVEAARTLLAGLIRQNPDSEDAWLLLGRAVSDSQQQADCLRQVLRLNPANETARRQLEDLSRGIPKTPPATPQDQPGKTANTIYIAEHPPEPGLDFWVEDNAPSESQSEPLPSRPSLSKPVMPRPAMSKQPPVPLTGPPSTSSPVTPKQEPTFLHPADDLIPSPLTGELPKSPLPSFTPDSPATAPEAPASSEQQPEPAQSQKEPAKSRKVASSAKGTRPKKMRRSISPVLVISVVLVLLAAIVAGGIWAISIFAPGVELPQAPEIVQQVASSTPSPTEEPTFGLPPTWTPKPTNTLTLTPTITNTPRPSSTPTLIPPPPTAQALIERIQQEVSDLRGLPGITQVPGYIVPPLIAEKMLTDDFIDEAKVAQLTDEALTLSALGLIKPTYNIVNYALNGIIDNIGGFYRSDVKSIYILGMNFRAVERLIYSHEYDHALIDQYYDIAELKKQQNCENDDRCTALKALLEGDATLAMNQWLVQYASPQDVRELRNYHPPTLALPEKYPPDYVIYSLDFPYNYGQIFVQDLLDEGNWARVNQAYNSLPQSTEQIIHPEKYRQAEAPIPVEDFPLYAVLNEEWRMIKDNTLGEWTTYLMLAYGTDKLAQQSPKAAGTATAGWGGDRYQVFYKESTEQTVLAAHWFWDTDKDALEFTTLMREYLGARFRGSTVPADQSKSDHWCWEINQQATCFYSFKNQSLWLLAPDQATLDLVLNLYPSFSIP